MNTLAFAPVADLTLENLYRNYRMAIFNVCYGYTKNRDEAHDLVQETFVKAYLGLPGFEGRSHPKTWLIRIAINQSLTRVMANKRGRRNLDTYLENEAWEQAQSRDDLPISNLGVEEVLKCADVITRKVLLLSFQQGLTHSEIAKTLGVSRVAITRRISRFKEQANLISEKARPLPKPPTLLKMARDGKWMRETSAYGNSKTNRFREAVAA